MFLGHFAAGLLASRSEPRLPLGTAFLTAQLPDAIWPFLLLTGAERVEIAPGDTAVTPLRFVHYPWSHNLLMVILLVIYSANLLGPPPPSVIAIAVSLIALVPILWWSGNRASPAS